MAKLFFSYSHKDEELRNELEAHLSMLKRQGLIEPWHDRRISAGSDFSTEISDQLKSAEIILLLVSPYFLASDYCYGIEMQEALKMHYAKQAIVIPVILHPCDWHSAPFGKLLATPPDGKPISKFPNQHDAYFEVIKSIKGALQTLGRTGQSENVTSNKQPAASHLAIAEKPRSSNLRIKKIFSDRDKDSFLDSTFEYIANFFENSLNELERRNEGITGRFRRIDQNHFTSSIYRNGDSIAQCKIWIGGNFVSSGGIAYSNNINSSDHSMNESLTVETDGYTLHLKALGMAFMRSRDSGKALTQEGAAEYFWGLLVAPLQD